jgi:predicted DNA-binding protein (UPF0251 family)
MLLLKEHMSIIKGAVMARPCKSKKVCCMPKSFGFTPMGKKGNGEIIMTIDEYEAVRLMDYVAFTQEESAVQMNIARTTFQRLYENAREKLAKALIEGLAIKIEGGNYVLCDGKEAQCRCGGCQKHKNLNI